MIDPTKRMAELTPEKRKLVAQKLQKKLLSQQLQKNKARSVSQTQILPQERKTNVFPPSFAQNRLWFLHQLEPYSAFYNVPSALRLTGKLRVDALERSLAKVVQRHEVLRTTFHMQQEQPVQVISPSLPIQVAVLDLQGLSAAQNAGIDSQATQLAEQEAQCPFDLTKGPLLRVYLLRLSEDDKSGQARPPQSPTRQEHILLLTLHHIVSDDWSMGILVRELALLYQAEINGESSPLPELPIQYADYTHWQRQWLQGEVLQSQLAYWRKQLAGAPALLELPTDRPRPAVQRYVGALQSRHLSLELLQQLKSLSQQEGTTLFITTLAIFQTLLMRYSAQTDIVVGTPMANRMREELEGLIGFFVNTVVLRTDLSGNPTFLQLLARVHEMALQGYMHQDIPFEKLVEELQPKRDLSYQPLFQILFSLENAPHPSIELPGLSLRPLPVKNDTAKFDLSLMLSEEPAGLWTIVEYNTDLFDDATITRLLNHWQVLLEAILHDPRQHIETLPLLTAEEREQLLAQDTAIRRTSPQDLCIHQIFEQQVKQTPDAIAVVACGFIPHYGPVTHPGLTTHLTYHQLDRQANRLAHRLVEAGVGPESVVGIYMQRSPLMLISILAVFKAGAAYLPLDPSYPEQRLRSILAESQLHVILTQLPLHTRFDQESLIVLAVESGWDGWETNESDGWGTSDRKDREGTSPTSTHLPDQCVDDGLNPSRPLRSLVPRSAPHDQALPTRNSADNLAYVIYTSGSTGLPKGAMVTQRGMVNYLLDKVERFQLQPTERIAQTASHCFDISVWQFLAALLAGGQVCILPDEITHHAGLLFAEASKQSITMLELIPSLLQAGLDDLMEQGGRRDVGLSPSVLADTGRRTGINPRPYDHRIPTPERPLSLRWMLVTGEACPTGLVNRWTQSYPHIPLVNAYGPAECSDDVTHAVLRPTTGMETQSASIGSPIANMRVYILDQQMQLLPIGVPGEIYIGGVGLGRGYLHDPVRTAQAFVPNPFVETERLYRTGDLGRYLPNGEIEYLGRIDSQVKLRGFRIELGEIEATLQAHPAVQEAVVILRVEGQGLSVRKYLVAYVTPAPTAGGTGQAQGTVPTAPVLQGYLRERLPDYMIPNSVVLLETMPLNPNGKVDRVAIGLAPMIGPHDESTFAAPRTEVEQILVNIWQQALGLPEVGIHDNFFELGGDSILSLQMLGRARQAGFQQLTLKHLFQHQTIAQLATVAIPSGDSGSTLSVLPPMSPHQEAEVVGPVPLTPIQHWFFEQDLPQPQHFNQSIMVLLPSSWNRRYLQQVLDALLVHHAALRLRFEKTETGWHQRIVSVAEAGAIAVVQIDLTQFEASDQSRIIEQVANCAQASLDLKYGPLLRVLLFDPGNGQPARLLVVSHHMTIDSVSWRVLLEDFQLAMAQIQRNEPIALPAETVSFQRWAEQLQELAQSACLQEERTHWLISVPSSGSRKDIDSCHSPTGKVYTPNPNGSSGNALRTGQMPTVPFPLDWAEGSNTEADACSVHTSMTIEETRLLLQEVPRSYGSNILELLLTAVVQTLANWVGSQQIRLDMEGHGREELGTEILDVSRTMGWFTSIYPMHFTLPQQGDCGERIKTIKEHMQSVPHKGIGYGLLRYCSHGDPELRAQLASASPSQVCFNYQGQFDQVRSRLSSGEETLEIAPESCGATGGPQNQRRYLLELIALVAGEQLHLEWVYSKQQYLPTTIERLADGVAHTLGELLAYCIDETRRNCQC